MSRVGGWANVSRDLGWWTRHRQSSPGRVGGPTLVVFRAGGATLVVTDQSCWMGYLQGVWAIVRVGGSTLVVTRVVWCVIVRVGGLTLFVFRAGGGWANISRDQSCWVCHSQGDGSTLVMFREGGPPFSHDQSCWVGHRQGGWMLLQQLEANYCVRGLVFAIFQR